MDEQTIRLEIAKIILAYPDETTPMVNSLFAAQTWFLFVSGDFEGAKKIAKGRWE